MGIFNRLFQPWKGCNRSGMARITGSVLIGSAGAVTSYDLPGATVTLVNSKTGRYRVQLVEPDNSTTSAPSQPTATDGTTAVTPWGIQAPTATLVSEQTDNALTKDAAAYTCLRNFTPLSGYFDIQCFKSDESSGETHTDANPASGAQILIGFDVKTSNVTP